MISRNHASVALSLFYFLAGTLFAGDHHLGHYYTTTTTTRTHGTPPTFTTSQPFVMVPQVAQTVQAQSPVLTAPTMQPASMPVFSAVPQAVVPSATFFHMVPTQAAAVAAQPVAYYQLQPVAAPTASGMTAPPLLAPIASVPAPVASGQTSRVPLPLFSGNVPSSSSPSHVRTSRIFDTLKSFLQSNLQHSSAVLFPLLKNVGLNLLRGELAQFGLGGLVPVQPHPDDVSTIEDMVKKLLAERNDSAAGTLPPGVANNSGATSMTFSGPVTLQFNGAATINVNGKPLQNSLSAEETPPRTGDVSLPPPTPPATNPNPVGNDQPPGA